MAITKTLPVMDACWRHIGVRGDRTCDRLPAVIHCQNCEVFSNAAKGLLDRQASDEYLQELTGFVAEPAESRNLANQSVLLFALGSENYAVWARDVLEVAETAPARRVPHRSNGTFLGLVNIQGRLELCMSLAGLLGIARGAAAADEKQRVLVVTHSGARWVFAIDAVKGMHRVHSTALLEVPATSARRASVFLSGLLTHPAGRFGVLDVPRVCEAAAEQMR